MRKAKLFPLLISLFFLQACPAPTQIENTAIINVRGIDLPEEGDKRTIETTIIPFVFDPGAADTTDMLIGRGQTIRQALKDAGNQSSFLLSPGKINMELYGKEAAEAGILPFINTLIRDARVSDMMQLAVTNITARELLEMEQDQITINPAEYLQDLIEKEVNLDTLPRNTWNISHA